MNYSVFQKQVKLAHLSRILFPPRQVNFTMLRDSYVKSFMPLTYDYYTENIANYGRTGKSSGRAVRVRDRVCTPGLNPNKTNEFFRDNN